MAQSRAGTSVPPTISTVSLAEPPASSQGHARTEAADAPVGRRCVRRRTTGRAAAG